MTALTNLEMVRRSAGVLVDGLRPCVETAMRKRHNKATGDWVTHVYAKISRNGAPPPKGADLQFLLSCMSKHWEPDFRHYGRAARGYVSLLIETRNEIEAHYAGGSADISADTAQERVWPMVRLLEAVKAPEAATAETILVQLKQRAALDLAPVAVAEARRPHTPAESTVIVEPIPVQTPATNVHIPEQAQSVEATAKVAPRSVALSATRHTLYGGKIPANAPKDAKYTCGLDGSIRLLFDLGDREETLLTTDKHPDLVAMVQAAKAAQDETPAGVFYINEYGHVLVKAAGGTWYAGTYTEHLDFEFDGRIIGPCAPEGARPGDLWYGPHVGINYTLTADRRDIYYRRTTRPGVRRRELLSDYADASVVIAAAHSIKQQGGRLYINEARVLFTPVKRDGQWVFVYLSTVDLANWFPAPEVSA